MLNFLLASVEGADIAEGYVLPAGVHGRTFLRIPRAGLPTTAKKQRLRSVCSSQRSFAVTCVTCVPDNVTN